MVKEYSKEVRDKNIAVGFLLIGLYLIRHIILNINIWIAIVMEILAGLFVLIYLNSRDDINIKNLFKWENLKYILFIFLINRIIGIVFSYIGIGIYGGVSANDQALIKYAHSLNGIELVEFYIYKNFWAPIREEYVYKYMIIGNIGKMRYISLIISSIIFSFGHRANNILYFTMYFFMALIPAIIYKKTGRVDICIAEHMLNNIIVVY